MTKFEIKNIVEEVMVMKTKVLVLVGLFLVSVLGISSEIKISDQEMYHLFAQYSLNAKIFD